MQQRQLSADGSNFQHAAAVARGAALVGVMLGTVLFIWSATTLRHELVLPGAAGTSASLIVTFVDLAHRSTPAPSRDVIRLAR